MSEQQRYNLEDQLRLARRIAEMIIYEGGRDNLEYLARNQLNEMATNEPNPDKRLKKQGLCIIANSLVRTELGDNSREIYVIKFNEN